jgi:hypothetical protein
MDITSDSNIQYTNDTVIPVSKNFLKKTLVKNEAIKRANKELLDLYNIAINKKPEVKIEEKEKIKYVEIKKKPTLSEQYNIYKKINKEKIKEENKNKKYKEIFKKKKEQLELQKYNNLKINLENNIIYQKYKKEADLLDKIFYEPKKQQQLKLQHLNNFLDNISIYDSIFS